MMDAHLVVERPRFRLDVKMRAAPGEVVALFGPEGAGKTTALRVLAGLTPPSAGYVLLDGEPLHARPAERRPIGVVFQDPLLFPHLSALDNVAFGPRCHGASKAEARRAAGAWLERVGMGEHRKARPRNLSTTQAGRVALARALALRPRLLLLDDPLAGLDAGTRLAARTGLHRHLADLPGICLLVTHDPLDATALADRVMVIESGNLREGPPGG